MPQPLPDDIKAASALTADQFLTLPEAMHEIMELKADCKSLSENAIILVDTVLALLPQTTLPDAVQADTVATAGRIKDTINAILDAQVDAAIALQHKAGAGE